MPLFNVSVVLSCLKPDDSSNYFVKCMQCSAIKQCNLIQISRYAMFYTLTMGVGLRSILTKTRECVCDGQSSYKQFKQDIIYRVWICKERRPASRVGQKKFNSCFHACVKLQPHGWFFARKFFEIVKKMCSPQARKIFNDD